MWKRSSASLLLALVFSIFSSPASSFQASAAIGTKNRPSSFVSTSVSMASVQEIEVISQPDQAFLEKKGVFGWGTWGCGVSKFPWTYSENESCYLLAGKVTVTPDGGGRPVTFGKGDFVTFPAGMSCTWDVTEEVKKHFMFF